MSDALNHRDRSVGRLVADRVLDGEEPAPFRLAARTSAIALDRWGRDLTRDAPDQEWPAFRPVVEETARDVLDHFADGEADVDGVAGLVFEGYVVTADELAEQAIEVTRAIEETAAFDRHEPGGLVEPVDDVEGGDRA